MIYQCLIFMIIEKIVKKSYQLETLILIPISCINQENESIEKGESIMNKQINLFTIDKILHKFGILNTIINRILILLIPQSVAIACTPTPNWQRGSQCGFVFCSSETNCYHWYKYYTIYYDNNWSNPCQICDYWAQDSQKCSPCPV